MGVLETLEGGDSEFQAYMKANKLILVIFQDASSELEADVEETARKISNVKYLSLDPSKVPEATKEYDIADHELPTFLFLEDGIEMDKLASGLSYQQLNGSGVTTQNLINQMRIVFRL